MDACAETTEGRSKLLTDDGFVERLATLSIRLHGMVSRKSNERNTLWVHVDIHAMVSSYGRRMWWVVVDDQIPGAWDPISKRLGWSNANISITSRLWKGDI
jgi:hypothetical protein